MVDAEKESLGNPSLAVLPAATRQLKMDELADYICTTIPLSVSSGAARTAFETHSARVQDVVRGHFEKMFALAEQDIKEMI